MIEDSDLDSSERSWSSEDDSNERTSSSKDSNSNSNERISSSEDSDLDSNKRTESELFWELEPYFRPVGGPCNFVFTSDRLLEFLRKHCLRTEPEEAAAYLSKHSIRINKSSFDTGKVIKKQRPPFRQFDLSALPNELVIHIMEFFPNLSKHFFSPPRTLQMLSLTSKRIRALAAPILFNTLNLNKVASFRRFKDSGSLPFELEKVLEDPISCGLFKYTSAVFFDPNWDRWCKNLGQAKYSRTFEAMEVLLSNISTERQNHGYHLTKFAFHRTVCTLEDYKDFDSVLMDGIKALAESVYRLPSLRVLELHSNHEFQKLAKEFLTRSPRSLHTLSLLFGDFISPLLRQFPVSQLRHLVLPSIPISVPLHSNLATLIITSGPGRDLRFPPWDLGYLWGVLAVCAKSLKVLHLDDQEVQFREWSRHGTKPGDIAGFTKKPIPFEQLTILRLDSVHPSDHITRDSEDEDSEDEDLDEQAAQFQDSIGMMLADFFSLAPIRRLYIRDCMELDFFIDGEGVETFWERISTHRLDQKTGWMNLELVVHGHDLDHSEQGYLLPYMIGSDALEKDGVNFESDRMWEWEV